MLFVSDNGACPFDRTRGKEHQPWDPKSYWCYSPGWAHVGNTPFRLYKQNQHEGGITSPTIVHWPAGLKTKPGSITDQPAHLIDIMPTVCDLSGAGYLKPNQSPLSPNMPAGTTLLPILEDRPPMDHEKRYADALYFRFDNNRAVRHGDWKLVSFRGSPWELYDLSADRTELNDLAKDEPELVEQLSAKWHDWAEHVNLMNEKQRRPVKDTMQKPNF